MGLLQNNQVSSILTSLTSIEELQRQKHEVLQTDLGLKHQAVFRKQLFVFKRSQLDTFQSLKWTPECEIRRKRYVSSFQRSHCQSLLNRFKIESTFVDSSCMGLKNTRCLQEIFYTVYVQQQRDIQSENSWLNLILWHMFKIGCDYRYANACWRLFETINTTDPCYFEWPNLIIIFQWVIDNLLYGWITEYLLNRKHESIYIQLYTEHMNNIRFINTEPYIYPLILFALLFSEFSSASIQFFFNSYQ